MEAKELQIGDWIHITYENYNFNAQVEGLEKTDDGYCAIVTKSQLAYGDEDGFEPIPITAEILKANGFVDGVLPYSLCNTELQLSMQDNNGFWAFGINTEHTEFCDLAMNYVNELQHALRLCGLTELADNFKVIEE